MRNQRALRGVGGVQPEGWRCAVFLARSKQPDPFKFITLARTSKQQIMSKQPFERAVENEGQKKKLSQSKLGFEKKKPESANRPPTRIK